ncbi:MAG: transglutaminase family protein [Bacteroidota bacterium]
MKMSPDFDPQLEALISLLDEPDHGSFIKVRDQIFAYGSSAVPLLENAWENTFDNSIQQRIEDIIHNIQYDQLFLDLTQWAHYGNSDLLEAYLIFTRYQFQSIDQEAIRQQIKQIHRDIWLELNDNLTALEKVKVLNHIIYDLHGMQLPTRQVSEPRFLFLNNLLDSRTGYSFAIGVLYTLLAQSLNLPVYGVILPGERYVMAWLDASGSSPDEKARVMFYINPENRGGVFTRNEIAALLKKMKIPADEKIFRPVSARVILDKFFELLSYLYSTNGENTRVREIDHLRSALQ